MTVKMGVLVSGSGTNLQALIDSFSGDESAQIAVVISNKKTAYGLERASMASIPTAFVDHRGKARENFDAELVECLRSHGVEWVVLAGFMRIITPTFLDAFPGRIINIHPSLLPSFPGLNAQQQAFDAGVPLTGATVHFVDGGLDAGPIIAQGVVPRQPKDDVEDLRARILEMEHRLYPMVLRWAVNGQLTLEGGRAVVRMGEGESRVLWPE
jgi:phosphoribosylglycinamide formyltransferase-1